MAIVQLALDTYYGNLHNYNKTDANEVLRKELVNLAGGKDKFTYKDFRKVKPEFFEIIEEVLTVLVREGLEQQFDGFAEIRNVDWGDQKSFLSPNTELFDVALISTGNNNIRRQRLDVGVPFTVDTHMRGVKIYTELYQFLAGRIDWQDMVNRISRSWNVMMRNEIYDNVYKSFDQLQAPYKLSASYSETNLTDIAEHVGASTGTNVRIYGTRQALAQVTPSNISDDMKGKRNEVGYYGVVNGYPMYEIKQSHKIGGTTWAIDNSFLLILPDIENKFVKIVQEGDAIIQEGQATADETMEYLFKMKIGFAFLSSASYGIFRLA